MIDEHTRESLPHLVERSITAEKLVVELEKVFTARSGPPKVLWMDNGPEMIPMRCNSFAPIGSGSSTSHPGTPWNNGFIESFNRRLRSECLNRNHLTSLLEVRVVIGDFKLEHNRRHRHSALGYLTPAEYAAREYLLSGPGQLELGEVRRVASALNSYRSNRKRIQTGRKRTGGCIAEVPLLKGYWA